MRRRGRYGFRRRTGHRCKLDHGTAGSATLLVRALVISAGVVVAAASVVCALVFWLVVAIAVLVVVAPNRRFGTDVPVVITGHRWTRTVSLEVRELVRKDGHEILEWGHHGSMSSEGTDPDAPRHDPAVPDDRCADVGCRHPGARSERLEIRFESPDGHEGDPYACTVDETSWLGWRPGDEAIVRIGAIFGHPLCDTLTRPQDHPTLPGPVPPVEPPLHELDRDEVADDQRHQDREEDRRER